jgi:hypothetical protein
MTATEILEKLSEILALRSICPVLECDRPTPNENHHLRDLHPKGGALTHGAPSLCRALPFELSVMTPKFGQEQLSSLADPDGQSATLAPLSDSAREL